MRLAMLAASTTAASLSRELARVVRPLACALILASACKAVYTALCLRPTTTEPWPVPP
eukprot:CAMPEP_0202899098 /NCGR_PEP_ID=MMETSP1392-20130828/7427_1 /ASSEMBLY_ACC=CAM_ASM_000868 /TAXON_ID=225041 /ORGANISM="Chlamydomonas chlamydogama, Strain SAG 11-48b" /LENGTH=57 /DNA_ID=CAMNT_0049585195 /DNA_START=31 /DNA_END=201 /DNA_ORIENTATION=+